MLRKAVVLPPLEDIEPRHTIRLRASVLFRVFNYVYGTLTTAVFRSWNSSEIGRFLTETIRWAETDLARNLSLVAAFALLTDVILGIISGKSMVYTVPRLVGVACILVYITVLLPRPTD